MDGWVGRYVCWEIGGGGLVWKSERLLGLGRGFGGGGGGWGNEGGMGGWGGMGE